MRTISFMQAVREALAEEMRRDSSVFLLGEDIGEYGGAFGVTAGMLDEFGAGRVVETPISENGFVGVAVGAAVTGLRPVVEIMFMDFLTLAADQIVNHAAKLRYIYGGQVKVPMVIRTPAGGGRGYGASHSQSLEGMFCGVPGLKVVAPSTARHAKGLLKSAIRDDNPVLFVEHKLLYAEKSEVCGEDEVLPLGKAYVRRAGNDVTIVAHSRMVSLAEEAATDLAEQGVDVEIVDLCSLKPLDTETVHESVRKTGRVVIAEEGARCGGVGAEVAASIAEECLPYMDGRIVRVGMPDVPIPSSLCLEGAILPQAGDIVEACLTSLSW
jgi:pyruvate dehydrogenase E1 component beta subunit